MAYEKPITIKEAIASIEDGEYVLPSIQREFVWDTDQMETLFDSLMRDYPISTFLFWKVKAENVKKFQFYRFLKNYHERDSRHNEKGTFSETKDIIGVLDGQQRLTSLYVSLKGSYASRLSHHRVSSDHAYPQKHLYLNLLQASGEMEMEYDFRFLSAKEANESDASHFWFQAGKILEFSEIGEAFEWISDKLDELGETRGEPLSKDTKKFARNTLNRFYKVVCEAESLNFFLEKSEELDKVLQIFIRINQGGTKLSYSDLLLSIATAQWKDLDARKVIHEFVDKINDTGKGFDFNKDFVLKNCLVLADLPDIKFKVDNFTTENMAIIEKDWEAISNSISLAVQLAAHFGFDEKTLTSTNAIIPIAYFLKKKGIGENILHAKSQEANRESIQQWLIRALLRRHFGGQPDSLYPIYRQLIEAGGDVFPLQLAIDRFATLRPLDFYDDDIDNLLNVKYGTAFAFMLLSLLYPQMGDYEFHQDHIHPKRYFTNKRLKKLGIEPEELRENFLERFNRLANLQLLQATPNQEKSDTMLETWLSDYRPETADLKLYKEVHLFPPEASLAFADFVDFFDDRQKLIRSRLMDILNVKRSQKDEDAT
jgi:uncharacterized protein with ParB-like and HNH nuclease domain